MASKSQEYVDLYSEFAMEQMRKYGIPASITLAQGIIESASGGSRLAMSGNNHFGIKATQSWIDAGGKYGLHTDDRPNEKFCYYDSVADSYEHHSKFLKGNSRYDACFVLAPDDYRGWANALQRAGYASSNQYASSLISVIDKMDLTRYDRMVMEELAAKGLKPGEASQVAEVPSQGTQQSDYSFPLKRDEFLFISSPYGNRNDPMDRSKTQFHKGVDIQCKYEPLLATETGGKVVGVNEAAGTSGGKSVTIEYDREDGTKYRIFYCHLSDISVKVGDSVVAGQQIGVSGNTGTRTTGPHLHFEARQVLEDGTVRNVDPCAYLAEIAQKGGIGITAMKDGQDLLAKYKDQNPLTPESPDLAASTPQIDTELSPEEWMKKLLSSEDSGISLGSSNDPIMELAIALFTSLMALANQIDQRDAQAAMAFATESALNGEIDLSSMVPGYQDCRLAVRESGRPVLIANNGTAVIRHELTANEMNRLNLILSDASLSDADKQQRIAGLVNNAVALESASLNYERGACVSSQTYTMQR